MRQELQRGHVTVDGVALCYVERGAIGADADAPMLLLHGLIATGETFGSLISELPASRRIVALDLPGAGFSARNLHADVSFGGMARVVSGFMEAVGLQRPVLLGHSHGGAVSLRLVVEQPELVSALVLLAPAHPFSGQERLVIRFYLSWFGRRLARVLPHLPAWMHSLAFRQMAGPSAWVDPAVLELYRQSGKVPGTVDHLLRLLHTWHADMDELRRLLLARPIVLPTLVLWGDHDQVVPEKTAPALERCFTQAEHVTLRGVGHLPNEERPVECAELIRGWLTKRPV